MHTPGPWTVEEYGDEDRPALVIHYDEDNRICFMATPGSEKPSIIEANACLIAAAPELLAALKIMIKNCDDMENAGTWHADLDVARAAVAKATEPRP